MSDKTDPVPDAWATGARIDAVPVGQRHDVVDQRDLARGQQADARQARHAVELGAEVLDDDLLVADDLVHMQGQRRLRAAHQHDRRMAAMQMAAAGLAQVRPNGAVEPPLVTSGEDFSAVCALAAAMPGGPRPYPAATVVEYLQGNAPAVLPDADVAQVRFVTGTRR